MSKPSSVVIDGATYVLQQPATGRAVVVVDRGWIFAGDIRTESGRIYLSNAVWVFKWESCGFAAVIQEPSKADIRPIADLDIPAGSEIFSIPVHKEWGLK
jgi:hypothetical protein